MGGFVPLSTVDYPGELSAVVFLQGCPWRCRYCHNPHLQPRAGAQSVSWAAIMRFLERRAGLLDAVVFRGGEPTVQRGLERSMGEVRNLGYKIGLHTAGMYPGRLKRLLPLLDWVGMDIKAPAETYGKITGVHSCAGKAWTSAALLVKSGVACEFRTTVHPALLGDDDIRNIARRLAGWGARHYTVQKFRGEGCIDPELVMHPGPTINEEALHAEMNSMFATFRMI